MNINETSFSVTVRGRIAIRKRSRRHGEYVLWDAMGGLAIIQAGIW